MNQKPLFLAKACALWGALWLFFPGCSFLSPYPGDACPEEGKSHCWAKKSEILLCTKGNWKRSTGSKCSPGSSFVCPTKYKLTCHDNRPGIQQCVHYSFIDEGERDDFYKKCAGLHRRTKNAHNCPTSGLVGRGFCQHEVNSSTTRRICKKDCCSGTYTYTGSALSLKSRCSSTGGTWISR